MQRFLSKGGCKQNIMGGGRKKGRHGSEGSRVVGALKADKAQAGASGHSCRIGVSAQIATESVATAGQVTGPMHPLLS